LTAEQTEFQQQIEAFARDVVAFRAAGIDRSGEFPADVIHAAAQHGLCGVTIPKQWGGAGRDYVSYALAIEAIARASATVAVALGVGGLGCMDVGLDVLVADDQVIGQVDQGFRLAMWALQGGRVAIAAQALGIGQAALDEAIAYAKQREQFGQPIANYQAIQWMLADMATELAAARMLTLKA